MSLASFVTDLSPVCTANSAVVNCRLRVRAVYSVWYGVDGEEVLLCVPVWVQQQALRRQAGRGGGGGGEAAAAEALPGDEGAAER